MEAANPHWTKDQQDARDSALVMFKHAQEFAELEQEPLNLEGRIWYPSAVSFENREGPKERTKGMDLGLKDKVAIVAAGSQGLGRAVALELTKQGALVAICSRSIKNLQEGAAAIQKATGHEPFWRAVDVTDAVAVKKFVAEVVDSFRRVDICVTNAGGPPAKKFLDVTLEDWRAAIDLNLMSTVHFAREVLPLMQKNKWGRLITITSISVKQPVDGLLLSNSVRAAVAGLARTLANEFGPDGITVNNVCPGYTTTDRLNDLGDTMGRAAGTSRDAIFAKWSEQIPLRRLARPEEFAALVTFLASERASYITGTSIPVDGGWVKSLL